MLDLRPSTIARLALAAALGTGLTACDEPDPDPCDSDPTGCTETFDFEVDGDCSEAEQEGELHVQWGPRDEVWGPQGGAHLEVGAWVGNFNPGRERALVTFSVINSSTNEDTGEVSEWVSSEHSVEIGAGVWEAQGNGVGVSRIVWLTSVDEFEEPPGWRVDVIDACGRTGFHRQR